MGTVRTATVLILIAIVLPVIVLSPFLELSEHLTAGVPEVDEISLGLVLALCSALAFRKSVSHFLRVALRNSRAATWALPAGETSRVVPTMPGLVPCRFIALCDLRI